MKKCNRCGADLDDGALFCPVCGAAYNEKKKKQGDSFGGTGGGSYDPRYGYIPDYAQNTAPIVEGRSRGIVVLSFIFPIVGLIIWYSCRYTRPGRAASAWDGALSGVCFGTPLIGAVLWYIWRFSRRDQAKMCGLAALIGVGFSLFYSILYAVMLLGFGVDPLFWMPLA
jgi:hypothetical protein